jgi:signal transduction histidine kinase
MPPKVEVGSTPDGESIRFWVRDNGRGFTNEQKDHLFVPLRHFDQNGTLKKGYGLKLSLVRRLVEKCGGQVGVETKIGRGSTFYFTLRAIA